MNTPDYTKWNTYHFSACLGTDSGHRAELRGDTERRLDPRDRGGGEGSGRASEDGDGGDGFHV